MRQEFTFSLSKGYSGATRLALAFIIWSALWVIVSDYVVHLLPVGPRGFWAIQTDKGLVYVIVSGTLLWLAVRAMERDEAARRALNESKLRLLKESGLICVADWGTDDRITYANESLGHMLGYTHSELIGMDVNGLIPPEYTATRRMAQEELAQYGRTSLHEFELVRRDGTRVAMLGGRAKLGEGNENLAYFMDISALKKSEERRMQLQSQLSHSEKLNALGQLAGGVAHDFNNELAIITGYTSMVESRPSSDPATVRDAQQVLKAADRARKLIQQLLAFSRKQTLQREVVDLNEIIDGMRSMLRHVLTDNIELKVEMSSQAENVEIDSSQFEQIILNLVVNARDAMPHGGVLSISLGPSEREIHLTTAKPAAADFVTVTVSDTGIGIDESTRKRIFEPFFTTKQQTGGTGLGLSTVYGIVKQCGGEISVTSEVGSGSRFTLQFPRAGKEPRIAATDTPPHIPHALAGTILLVEDMDDLREMMTQALSASGLSVLTARDGLDAVELASRIDGVIDLVLTDIVMPRMSGPEAVRSIRASRPGVKVIYISGCADMVDTGDTDIVIWKPVKTEILLQTIQDCLDRASNPGPQSKSAA
jgi:PAS domain S-box-containing protein